MLAAFATRCCSMAAISAELADATANSTSIIGWSTAATLSWARWPCDVVVEDGGTTAATNGSILVVAYAPCLPPTTTKSASDMVEAVAKLSKLEDASIDSLCRDAQSRFGGAVSLLVADVRCPEDRDRIRWFASTDALGLLPVYHGWVAQGAQVHVSTSRIAVAQAMDPGAEPPVALQAGHVLTSAHGGETPRPWRRTTMVEISTPTQAMMRAMLQAEVERAVGPATVVLVDGNTPRLGAALAGILAKGTKLANVTYKQKPSSEGGGGGGDDIQLDFAEAVRLAPEVVRCIETSDPVYVSACVPLYHLMKHARRRGHRVVLMPTTVAFPDAASACFASKQTYYHALIKMARAHGVRVHFPFMALRVVEAAASGKIDLDHVAGGGDELLLRLPPPAPREDYSALCSDLRRHYASMTDGLREEASKVAKRTIAALHRI